MSGGSRRPHSKTRNGCRQCKRRRVKCDAKSPCCSHCERRGETCEYPDLLQTANSDAASSSSSTLTVPSQTSSKVVPIQPNSITPLPLQELELMHHWSTSTYLTIDRLVSPEIQKIWQVKVPELAQTHPFLMHSVLAFSSAHKASLHPSQRAMYLDAARQHHVHASVLFRSFANKDHIGQSNSGPALLFSILTMLTSLSLLPQKYEDDNDLGNFVNWVLLIRRSLTFARSFGLTAGADHEVSSILMFVAHERIVPLTLDPGLVSSLEKLEALNMNTLTTCPEDKAVLGLSIAQTRQWFTCIPLRPESLLFILRWIAMLTDGYFELLSRRDPTALALLGHWIVPLYHAPKKWFVADWPRRVVDAIAKELGPDHIEMVRWAMEEINDQNE